MANVFDGPWRSTLINDRIGPHDDDRFNLEVDPATKHLRPSSTHAGQPVTGNVTDLEIRMTQTFPTHTVTYEGELCGEVMVTGVLRLVVIGVFTLVLITPLDEKALSELAKDSPAIRHLLETRRSQLQEIWVAAKP